MYTLICGNIDHDDVMLWCLTTQKYTEKEQSDCGRLWKIPQTVVYTNNINFYNGFRLGVSYGKIPYDLCTIIFIDSQNNEHYIKINEMGIIMDDHHIDGFFDQFSKDLLELI